MNTLKNMRSIYLFLIAALAGIVLTTGETFGLEVVQPDVWLNCSIDWFEGFTGHADDGVMLATGAGAAAVPAAGAGANNGDSPPAKQGRHAGPNGEDGAGAPAGVTGFTEGQFQRILEQIGGAASEPTDVDIRAAMERIAAEDTGSGASDRNAPTLNPGPASQDADARAGEDRVAPWRRRTVRYFDALAVGKDDQARSMQLIGELRGELVSMTDRQWRDEDREAREIITESGLPRAQQNRLRSVLDLQGSPAGETRLHTTSTGDTPKAGYLLPKPFLAEVFVIVEQYGVARRLARAVPMAGPGNSLDLKNVTSKVAAYWTDEGANFTASDLVFSEGQLTLKKLAGVTSWTTELEEDMAISLLPIVQELFAESISEKEDDAFINGDGTAGFGGFTGVLNLSGAQAVTFSAGDTSGNALAESHLRDAVDNLSEVRQRNAAWLMHRTVFTHIKQMENSAGYRIFQEVITGDGDNTLLGFPVVTAERAPSLSSVAAGAPFIALGDYRWVLMGMKRGVTADISREAILQAGDGSIAYNAFQADGALLRISERIGYATPVAVEDAFSIVKTAAA